MKSLFFYLLQNNELSFLPASIVRLQALKSINLSHNCLRSFQAEIFEKLLLLEKLKINAITNNPNRPGSTELALDESEKVKARAFAEKQNARFSAIASSAQQAATTFDLKLETRNKPKRNK